MNRFWRIVIEPALIRRQPKTIIEIGAESGTNTRNLLEYSRAHDALLHIIDPAPSFDVAAWKQEHGDRFIFHEACSLEVLPSIGPADAVLIDGDHNWFTVYHELRQIEDNAREHPAGFPLVFLHDIGWPYAYRDLYYSPGDIPEEHRKPFIQLGMRPGVSELQVVGGLNAHLDNATYEHGPRNGVLTAIEDFLRTSEEGKAFIRIPGFHGLGILVPLEHSSTESVRSFLEHGTSGAILHRLVDSLEQDRVGAQIRIAELCELLEGERLMAARLQEAQRLEIEQLERKLDAAARTHKRSVAKARSQLAELEQERLIAARQQETYRLEIEQLEMNIGAAGRERKRSVAIARLQLAEVDLQLAEVEADAAAAVTRGAKAARRHQAASALRLEQARQTLGSELRRLAKMDIARGANRDTVTADIVICVHNALDHVRACLSSVDRHTDRRHRVILVDDGSDSECAGFLTEYVRSHPRYRLVRNRHAQGYTKAANRGMRLSSADWIVLLNSDTLVTPSWLERLLECGQSDSSVGIVGPLSNAASYQSVPERYDAGGWALNPIPSGWTRDQVAEAVATIANPAFPRVAFVNGFCFAIRRAVIDAIGVFDEDGFPRAYGEENDYCLRAAAAGFALAIADHAYVYHASTQTYSEERRVALTDAGAAMLRRKHGRGLIEHGVTLLHDEPTLAAIRQELGEHLRNTSPPADTRRATPGVLFLLPATAGTGGAHSVVLEAHAMRRLGSHTQVAIPPWSFALFRDHYPALMVEDDLFYVYSTDDDLIFHAAEFDVAVGTIFTSMTLVEEVAARHPSVMPAYYVQDYEPWFVDEASPLRAEAEASYTLIPEAVLFAKARWICDTVRQHQGVEVHQVSAGLDHDVSFPSLADRPAQGSVGVAAMVRPSTPWRGAAQTMRVLKRLAQEHGKDVGIHIFGCADSALTEFSLDRDFAFTNHGRLVREEVAALLRSVEIFVDFSEYQAFGLTALEAMACGCAVVVPARGGANEYAVDGKNSLVIDTSVEAECFLAASRLVANRELRDRLQRAARGKAAEFSLEQAASSELTLFAEHLAMRRPIDHEICSVRS